MWTRLRKPLIAAGLVIVSGCDALVETSYQGESRLTLTVSVLNKKVDTREQIVPVLAHVDDSRVTFRPVSVRGGFSPKLRLDVQEAPKPELLAPVDAFLAPDALVSWEYIGAVTERRVDQPIELTPKRAPLHPLCWNGGCDVLPGVMTEPCAEDDEACLERNRACPNGMCQLLPSGGVLPEGVEDVTGFAEEHVVLYTPKAIPARSWAALKLGAPKGLAPGYHLGKNREHDAEARWNAEECVSTARADVFERFNEEHETSYDLLTLSCLNGTQIPVVCEGVELPEGDAAKELASALANEEIDRGCLELAPSIAFVREPEEEPISVRIGDGPPNWFPTVPFTLAPVVGQEEVNCPGTTKDPITGKVKKPFSTARMTGYSGNLCPEDSLMFTEAETGFQVLHDAEERGVQQCTMSFVVSVPPGYRFRQPLFIFYGFAYREADSVQPTRITMTYAMAGETLSSQHVVSGTNVFEHGGDFFTLFDTPELTVPECSSECEAAELDLTVEVRFDTPEGGFTSFDIIDVGLELGVEWTTCTRDFPER